MQNPLDRVVFIQKVAAFTNKTDSLKDLYRLAYVNNSWNDTIKNYAFHLFQQKICDIKREDTLENICGLVIKSGVIWFLDVLLEPFKTVLDRANLLRLVFKNAPSHMAMMQLVLERIDEAGGTDLFILQLTATDRLGSTCLMLGCENSSSPEVMNLIFEKIVEVGGADLLKSQLSATDTRGWSLLMFAARRSSSPEVMELVLKKIVEGGGISFLKSQVSAADTDRWNCFTIVCFFSKSPEVVKLLAAVLFYLGLFRQQYEKLGENDKKKLKKQTNIGSASWTPDPESLAEVKQMLEGANNGKNPNTSSIADANQVEEEAAVSARMKKLKEEEAAELRHLMNVKLVIFFSGVLAAAATGTALFWLKKHYTNKVSNNLSS